MARKYSEWEDLGRSIEKLVDQAICSHDYQKLNQTIRQTVERAVGMGSEAVRRAVDEKPAPPKPKIVEEKNLAVLYGSPNGKTTAGILKIVGGSLLSCFSFVLTLASLVLMLTGGGALSSLIALAGFGGGIALIVSGIKTLGVVSRFKVYRRTLGQKTYCALEKLARSVGKPEKFVRRELRRMIDQGLFLEGHMDKEETQLITSHETYRYFEQSRLQLEQRQKQAEEEKQAAEKQEKAQAASVHTPQVQEVLDRGRAFVREIRRCNDAIPGEEISGKISRMELIVQKIFQRVETNPEVVPDLKKMMDYYLPMTVKLLNAYADMDAQPVQGQTIQNSKREIEQTLDTLNLAFEKLLDDLFEDTAMDVSSDISVLQTLLAQEGLTEDEFTKMRKN